MAAAVLSGGRIRAGMWHGLVRAEAAPRIEVTHGKVVLQGVTVTPAEGGFAIRAPIPVELLSEGVQTFLVRDAGADAVLGHFTIIAGVAMEDDIRAELDLLRAELDLLKRAFRRHCVETAG
jgi:hypothetical protein